LHCNAIEERAGADGLCVGVTHRAGLPDEVAGEQGKARSIALPHSLEGGQSSDRGPSSPAGIAAGRGTDFLPGRVLDGLSADLSLCHRRRLSPDHGRGGVTVMWWMTVNSYGA